MCATTPTIGPVAWDGREHGGMTQTVDFRGVPICRAGEWNGLTGKAVVTPEDLQAVVAAYQDGEVDKARVKLGHMSSLNDQALGDGAPAFGWVQNPRLAADGRTLLGDLVDVPRRLGEVVGKAYRNVSVELRKNVRTPSGRTHPTVLSGLALLGAAAPAVKGLDDLAALYASEPIPPAPTDHCHDGATVTINLGDALDTTPTMPGVVPGVGDSGPESPEVPGPETEGEPTMAFLDQAREKLGLPKDATEDQILAGMTALSEAPADPDTTVKAEETDVTGDPDVAEPDLKSETVDAPETVTVSKAQWDELTAQVAELAAERKAKHQEQVIESALSEGRIAPAEREKWTTALSAAPEATEVLLSSLAPRINVREQGSDVALSAGAEDDETNRIAATRAAMGL